MSQPPIPFYAQIISKYGLATFLAVYLVWQLSTGVSGKIEKIQVSLNEHISETAYYLRQICINSAQDETQRAACLAPHR